MILFLVLGIGVVVLLSAIGQTAKVRKVLASKSSYSHIPHAIQVFVLIVQAGELVRVVEHTNWVNVASALLLLTIVVASKSGIEAELN